MLVNRSNLFATAMIEWELDTGNPHQAIPSARHTSPYALQDYLLVEHSATTFSPPDVRGLKPSRVRSSMTRALCLDDFFFIPGEEARHQPSERPPREHGQAGDGAPDA